MFSSLDIYGFRGVRQLSASGFRRINLITGLNGSGKTTILEALYLLRTGALALSFADSLTLRRSSDMKWAFQALFPDLNASSGIRLSGRWASETLGLKISAPSGIAQAPTEGGGRARVLWSRGAREESFDVKVGAGQAINQIPADFTGPLHPAAMVTPQSGTAGAEVTLLSELIESKLLPELVSALQIIEPRLANIQITTPRGQPTILADVGLPKMLPLEDCGGGLTRLVGIAAQLLACAKGVVLVDELEVGLHHSVHAKLWAQLDGSSKRHNVQVFATTHSDELLRAGIEHFRRAPVEDFGVFRVDRRASDHTLAMYDREMQEAVLEAGFEVRG